MTREDIATSLKPLIWDLYGDYEGNSIIAAWVLSQIIYIRKQKGGSVTLVLGSDTGCSIIVDKSIKDISMEEAKIVAREWQIELFCSCFQMND